MNSTIIKGYLSFILLIGIFIPGTFYVVYEYTGSIVLSILGAISAYILWRLIFGGGLRKRQKFVDLLFSMNFPVSDEDPFLDSGGFFADKSWVSGNGYIGDVDQPMYVKANRIGIAVLYLCKGEEKPILIPWERVSQVAIYKEQTNDTLVRLFIPGFGMKILVSWDKRFNEYIPERVATTLGNN